MKQKSLTVLASIAVVGALALTAGTVLAWTGPTGTFPAGNVEAPINTGFADQQKVGGIIAHWFVGQNGIFNRNCSGAPNTPNTCFVLGGQPADIFQALNTYGAGKGLRVDIVGNLFIKDGNQAAGKVLTSDANGKATWGTAAGALPPGTLGQTLQYDGTKWVASSDVLNNIGLGAAHTGGGIFPETSQVLKNGHAFTLIGTNQTFMTWYPQGLYHHRAWAGFGTANSSLFTIANEFGASSQGYTGAGSIALLPGTNGAVGINSAAPDSRNGTVLDVNGHIKIAQSGAAPGRVLTATDADGFATWQPGVPEYKVIKVSGIGTNSANATCPSGYQVVGGGGHCWKDGDRHAVTSSEPGPGQTSDGTYSLSQFSYWHIDCESITSGQDNASAYAICAPIAGYVAQPAGPATLTWQNLINSPSQSGTPGNDNQSFCDFLASQGLSPTNNDCVNNLRFPTGAGTYTSVPGGQCPYLQVGTFASATKSCTAQPGTGWLPVLIMFGGNNGQNYYPQRR